MVYRKHRPPAKASREFVEFRLAHGDDPSTILKAHNLIVRDSSVRKNAGLWSLRIGERPLSKAEFRRIHDAWRKRPSNVTGRENRRAIRESLAADEAAKQKMAKATGVPYTPQDPQKAHDAGYQFRLTEDEAYREYFTEGS